jgi:hypothetical protein
MLKQKTKYPLGWFFKNVKNPGFFQPSAVVLNNQLRLPDHKK